MDNPVETLRSFRKQHDFFIGIDSDGCAFDSMEIKHKECFCPNYICYFDLQPVSKYARDVWEFVNLYSKSRGCNRFLALISAVDFLKEHEAVKKRGAVLPRFESLRQWVKRETKLGNPALIAEVEMNKDPELEHILQWSLAVNRSISRMVKNVPPYPFVKKSLDKMRDKADIMVVSQTPFEALEREWREHNIDSYVQLICGQEMGTKTEHIKYAVEGKYDLDKVLMIGDAPGDMKAALHNGALFFPINPGHEEESWVRFFEEGLDKFFSGTFNGEYQDKLKREFNTYLPEHPSW